MGYQYRTIDNNELYHYGVKGMKWGKKKSAYNWRTDPRNYERNARENLAAIKEDREQIAEIKTGKRSYGAVTKKNKKKKTEAQTFAENIKWNARQYKINKLKQANAAKAKNKKSKNAKTR